MLFYQNRIKGNVNHPFSHSVSRSARHTVSHSVGHVVVVTLQQIEQLLAKVEPAGAHGCEEKAQTDDHLGLVGVLG